ncbi:MFS transporter [Halorarum halophilum]|uniref:MFS transporter n=1 Tax=Halorarum halophilum TaxID=2743090 RepID=A0A7D5GGN0_9EURY|nr:MFS transporter [Halobaculum halophilum]QLG29248.1 MFS transporter [Halobaculum halophilum]
MSDDEGPRGSRRVLAVVAGANFSQLGVRLLLGAVVPFVLLELDTTKSVVGFALTGMWAAYALLQFPSGVLADRYGERPIMLAGVGGAAVGTGLVALAPTVALFGVAAVLLGAGAGLFFAPASSLLSRLFEARGGALGALTAGGALAGVAFPAVGGFLAEALGWRIAVGLGAIVTVPAFGAILVVLPRLPPANSERDLVAAGDPARLAGLLTRPDLAYTTIVAVCTGFTFQAFSSFFPTFLVQHRGLDPGTAGLAFGAAFALSSVAQPLAGRASDAYTRDAAIAGSAALTAVGLSTLVWGSGTVALVAGTAVVGAGISWPGTVQARIMDRLDAAERGYGFGLIRTTYMFLAASGSVVVGVLADVGGWPLAFGTVIGLLGCCLLLLGANRALRLGL